MKNLTTLMRSMTVLLFFVMVGASTAWAQTTYFAERNGIGSTAVVAPATQACAQSDPCDLADALSVATTAGDVVSVRVRDTGAMTRIDEDITFANAIELRVWVDDGPSDPKGMIAIEGDVVINQAVTVADGVTLYLQGGVTVSAAEAALTGDVEFGGDGDVTLTFSGTCPAGGVPIQNLGINDDVDVEGTCGTPANTAIRITNSLNVKSGDLDMQDATLHLVPVASRNTMVTPDGSVTIAAGSRITGRGHLMLVPEVPSGGPVTGTAKPDTLVILGPADGTASVDLSGYSAPDGTAYSATATPIEDNFFPSNAETAAANDFGTVWDVRPGTPALPAVVDDPSTPGDESRAAVPAVRHRVIVLLWVHTTGFDVTSGQCYNIKGGGDLQLDIMKTGQGGACISVPNVGDGGTSTVSGGALILSGVSRFDGRLRNHGNARTELRGVGQITEDLVIDGYVSDNDGDGTAELFEDAVGIVGSQMVRQLDCSGGATHHPRSGGVFVYGATTIVGDVILEETNPADVDGTTDGAQGATACSEGLYFSGVANAAAPGDATAADKKGSITSSILGALESTGRSYIELGDHNRYHSLALEDDVTSDGGLSVGYGTPATYDAAQNICAINNAAGKGNSVIFAGQFEQDININDATADGTESLSLMAVRVAKSDAPPVQSLGPVRIETGLLSVANLLEIERGTLVTEGNLSMGGSSILRIGEGRVHSGDARTAYAGDPVAIHYTNSTDLMTGDEISPPGDDGKSFKLPLLDVSSSATVTLSQPVEITGHLHLSNGTLNTGGNALGFARGVTVHHGSGDVVVGEGGSISYPAGAKYNPAAHGITVAYKAAGARTAGTLFPTGMEAPGPAHVTNVVIDGTGCKADPVITLNDGFSRVDGDITITRGTLDINGQHLVAMSILPGASETVKLGEKGYICDSGAGTCGGDDEAGRIDELLDVAEGLETVATMNDVRARQGLQQSIANLKSSWANGAKTSRTAGLIHFVGNGNTTVDVGTKANRKDLPAVIVKRRLVVKAPNGAIWPAGTVTVMSSLAQAAGTAQNTKENLDIVGVGGLQIDHGNVAIGSSVDVFNAVGGLVQNGGEMSLADGADNLNPDGRRMRPQQVMVGTDAAPAGHMVTAGTLDVMGGSVMVTGGYLQGNEIMMDSTGALVADSVGTFSTVDLNGGEHTVMGDFYVGPDFNKDSLNVYMHGAGCGSERAAANAGNTTVGGDYFFGGTGECHQDDQYAAGQQGLSGSVTFAGMEAQTVAHRYNADAYFGSVTLASMSMEGAGGIVLAAPATQNAHGTLTLKRGIIDTVDERFAWSMHNTTSENNLAGRNTATEGGVMLGSRDSYVNGPVTRAVSQGVAGGGVVTGGYLFPVGSANDDSTAARMVDNFRPLTLQFANDLGATRAATVDYVQQLEGLGAAVVEWPDDGLVVDAKGGGTLTLDALGNQFWLVAFDDIPAQDPNLRVAAEGLPNVFDAKGLRLIQWDCDLENILAPPSNPRLAGVYDLEEGPLDQEDNFAVNDRINGILNLTQEGVEVGNCNIIGVASNFLQNPINMPPVSGGFAKVQYIQNVADTPVDLYMNGNRVGNDWAFQTATQFANVVGGEHTLDVVAAGDADNSNPIASITQRFVHEGTYNVILHGDGSEAKIKVVEDVRLGAMDENSVEFYVVHGARELGEVDIRLINPIDNSEVLDLLANNISWDDVGAYMSLAPGGYNFEITTANNDRQIDVFRLELQQYRQQTFVLNLSGSGKSSAEGVSMLGVEQDGTTFHPSVITAAEAEEEIPTEFALQGNYPNPFNPSTNIQIDLPEKAEVTIQIIDMLGRHVMTVPAREIEAGAKRAVEINAARLASGAYLYRVIAKSASGTNIDSGRMMLIK